jgi:hypothetical protein
MSLRRASCACYGRDVTSEHLTGVPEPQTDVARAALEVATEYCSPALVNHCLRSYIWAVAYAERTGIGFDAELLYVSAMLHDIGLVPEFDSLTVPFEFAGGHVAWVFGAGAGWPPERRRRVSDVIVRHMWNEVDVTVDPEGHLLELATGLEISGRHPEWWPQEFRDGVLRALPRLGLRAEFLRCFQEQAMRKPEGTAAQAVANGIANRLAANVLDQGPLASKD